jgi:4-amino-4-deoxy-L-arabinose transferase-like glycosyltransferase
MMDGIERMVGKTAGRNYLLWILLVALALRLAAAWALGDQVRGLSGAHDEITYDTLGYRFASGHGMSFPEPWYPWIPPDKPQSYFSFSFSAMLSGIYALTGHHPLFARLWMALLSVVIVGLIYMLGERFFNRRVALLGAAIAAVYAYLIFYGVVLVTETPFTLFVLLAIYVANDVAGRVQRNAQTTYWHMAALGAALAGGVLMRQSLLLFVPVLLCWLAFKLPPGHRLRLLSIPLLILAAAIIPFSIRNYLLWHKFMLLETQFGHVFWNGNHPDHHGNFHPFKVFPIPTEVLASQNDVVMTDALLRLALQHIWQDPMDFVWLTVTRLRELFTFWPTSDSGLAANLLRLFSFGLFVPFMAIGAALNLRRLGELMPVYLFMAVHIGVHAISWSMVRYRMPVEPFLILFAAWTLIAIYDLLRAARWTKMIAPLSPARNTQQVTR